MTTLQTRVAAPAAPPLAVRARDLLTCEWVKLSSIRSTYLIMLITVVTALGLSGMNAAVNSSMATGLPRRTRCCPRSSACPTPRSPRACLASWRSAPSTAPG